MAAVAAPVGGTSASGWFRLPRWHRSAAEAAEPDIVSSDLEPTIFRFIIKHSWKPQLIALVLTLASFPFLYVSLDLPKNIINHAIRADAKFPQYVFGFEFDRVPYLMLLCGAFLATRAGQWRLQILHQHVSRASSASGCCGASATSFTCGCCAFR